MTTGNWQLQLLNRAPPTLRGNGCGFYGPLRLRLRLCLLPLCYAAAVLAAVSLWLALRLCLRHLGCHCSLQPLAIHGKSIMTARILLLLRHASIVVKVPLPQSQAQSRGSAACSRRWCSLLSCNPSKFLLHFTFSNCFLKTIAIYSQIQSRLWVEAHNISSKSFMRITAQHSTLHCQQKLCSVSIGILWRNSDNECTSTPPLNQSAGHPEHRPGGKLPQVIPYKAQAAEAF